MHTHSEREREDKSESNTDTTIKLISSLASVEKKVVCRFCMAGQGCQSPRQLQPTAMPQTVGCVCCADQLRKQYSVCCVCSTVWVVCAVQCGLCVLCRPAEEAVQCGLCVQYSVVLFLVLAVQWGLCVQYNVGCVCSTVWVVCAVQTS